MKNLMYRINFGLLFLGFVFIAIVSLLLWASIEQDKFDTACRAKGGTPIMEEGGPDICLKTDSAIIMVQ